MNQAISQIPNYRPGLVTWHVGPPGLVRWYDPEFKSYSGLAYFTGDVYISRTQFLGAYPLVGIPINLYHTTAHEYAHVLADYDYGWNWQARNAALTRWFGGTTVSGVEVAADCMAIAQGAFPETSTRYTTCQNAHWREGARILLAGRQLP